MKNNNHFGAQKGEISHSEMENLDRYLSPAAQTPVKAIRSPFPYLRQAAGGQEAAPQRKAAAELCGGASPGSRPGPQGPRALSRPGAPGAAAPRSTARRPCRELLPRGSASTGGPVGRASLVSPTCLGQQHSREGLGTVVCYLLPTASNWSLGNTAARRGGPTLLGTGWAQTPTCCLY